MCHLQAAMPGQVKEFGGLASHGWAADLPMGAGKQPPSKANAHIRRGHSSRSSGAKPAEGSGAHEVSMSFSIQTIFIVLDPAWDTTDTPVTVP